MTNDQLSLTLLTMPAKSKRLRTIFILHCILLAYILAELIWWFIALKRQNEKMAGFKMQELNTTDKDYAQRSAKILEEKKRKTAQYIGEGSIFFLLIVAGAVFVA